jgi:hypothetical protein
MYVGSFWVVLRNCPGHISALTQTTLTLSTGGQSPVTPAMSATNLSLNHPRFDITRTERPKASLNEQYINTHAIFIHTNCSSVCRTICLMYRQTLTALRVTPDTDTAIHTASLARSVCMRAYVQCVTFDIKHWINVQCVGKLDITYKRCWKWCPRARIQVWPD